MRDAWSLPTSITHLDAVADESYVATDPTSTSPRGRARRFRPATLGKMA